MAPTTVKAACSSETLSGMRADRLVATRTNSAWEPFEATRSPGLNEATPRPAFEDDGGVGVAKREGLVELGLDGLEGGGNAVSTRLLDDRLDLFWLLAHLADPPSLAKAKQHALCPWRNQGCICTHQYFPGARAGAGYISAGDGAVP